MQKLPGRVWMEILLVSFKVILANHPVPPQWETAPANTFFSGSEELLTSPEDIVALFSWPGRSTAISRGMRENERGH